MVSCLPTCDIRDLIFSQFSIDCCQKCVCFRGSAPGHAGGLTPVGQSWVTNRSCPDRRPCFHIHLPLATPLSSTPEHFLFTATSSLSPGDYVHVSNTDPERLERSDAPDYVRDGGEGGTLYRHLFHFLSPLCHPGKWGVVKVEV